jgi:CDP-glucose 4,6-dehydratase
VGKGITFLDEVEPLVAASTFRDKSVLVTGASGFLGSALVEDLLFLGARVYALSLTIDYRRPLFGYPALGESGAQPLAMDIEKVIHGDLRNRADCFHAVSVAEPDFVFHLGAMTQVTEAAREPIEVFKTNALGTMHMLEACRLIAPNAFIVVASSDKAYGDPFPGDLPLEEGDELAPVHPYDLSKSACDLIARSWGEYYDLNIQTTRMANIYGPGDTNWKRLIPGVMRWIIEGREPIIRSDGTQVRQYLYISDASFANLLLASHMAEKPGFPRQSAWNFAPEDRHSVTEIFEQISNVMRDNGYEVRDPIVLGEAQDETQELYLDTSWAESELGWRAKADLESGLTKTLAFLERYKAVEAR